MSQKDMNQRFWISRKMKMVAETWSFGEEELGRFLRENGVHHVELQSWRDQMESGLDEGKPMANGAEKTLKNRVKLLEEELMAAKAVIELQKKVQELNAGKKVRSTLKKSDR